VWSADEFDYELGMTPTLTHRPAPVTADRGERIAAYAIAVHRDGRKEIEVMSAADVEKVRQVSRAKDSGPWRDWTDRMYEKTVGRLIFKRLPLDPGDQRVARLAIDAEEIGAEESARMLYGPGGATFREIEAPKGSPQGAADGGPEASADTTQQAAVGEAGSGDEPGTDGTPAAAPGPEPHAPPAQGFQIPPAVLDEAGAHKVKHNDPKSGWNGRTISDIAADQQYGAAWLTWACGSDGDLFLSPDTVAAVRLFVEHRLPAIWALVIGGQP
jgi:recombination protein RecT